MFAFKSRASAAPRTVLQVGLVILSSCMQPAFSQPQQVSGQPINISGYVQQRQQQQQQQQQQWQQQQRQQSQQPPQRQQTPSQNPSQEAQERQQREHQEKQRKAREQAEKELREAEDEHKRHWPGIGRGSIIESELSIDELEAKLQAEFSGDVFDYSVYSKLPGYITKLHDGKITIEALNALDVWDEVVPEVELYTPRPTDALYHHEAHYFFANDVMRYLRQSNDPEVRHLRNRVERRLNGLLSMEQVRLAREMQAYSGPGLMGMQRQVLDLFERGARVFAGLERRAAAGGSTRPFSGPASVQSAKMLFLAQAQTAARIANPHSRLHQRLKHEYEVDPTSIASHFLASSHAILAFAQGLTRGVELTFLDLSHSAAAITKFTTYALSDPAAAVDLVWETIVSVEPERVAAAVQHYVVQNYHKLEYGSPAEKGEVIGRIVTDVILSATMSPYFANYDRFSRNEGQSFVKRVELLTRLARPVANEVGSIGNIIRDVRKMRRSGSGAGGAVTYLDQIQMLRETRVKIGNFGLGTVTRSEAVELGRAWVGERAEFRNDFAWISEDGLRQYRPPVYKSKLGYEQANLEWRHTPDGAWLNNGHLNIYPTEF